MVSNAAISIFKDASVSISLVRFTADEEYRIEELAKQLKSILDAVRSRST